MNERCSTTHSRRRLKIQQLSRVEGEGGVLLDIEDGVLRGVDLNIFESPRFFEAFLRGRHYDEVPDIVARICGICPVAYQMSAVHALESAFGVRIDSPIRRLRRLLYCGEWIESHALHIHLLHAPDFLGFESAIAMARDYPDEVERGLRLKQIGNRLLTVLGGRSIHPVSVCVGGFYRAPQRAELVALIPELEWAVCAAEQTVRWVMQFEFPDLSPDCEFVALSHPNEYAMNEGRVLSSGGLDVDANGFDNVFIEKYVPHSTALHSVIAGNGKSYLVGPLARINLNRDRLMPQARKMAEEWPVSWPIRNRFMSIVARALELLHACEEGLAIIRDYEPPSSPRVRIEARPAEGVAATEAPRGLLFHRFSVDQRGLIARARIVPPTAQNLRRMEEDLQVQISPLVQRADSDIMAASQELVRCYDPCLSCSTHMLRFKVHRH